MYSQQPHHPPRPQQPPQHQQQQPYTNAMDPYNPSYTNSVVRHQLPPPPPPHHLVIPPEPTPNESTIPPLSIPELADFASMMVYLMWHARRPSVMALHDLSKTMSLAQQTEDHQLGHSKETATIASHTSAAFKKFCKQVLTATQLSESVILLSLKYIAMLLQINPNIQGAEGSEYRLFTVALMLANKFLDDNTFTNKTWSEVTGMKVRDLNVMELEFLDVLTFKLFIQKDEFERYKGAVLLFRNQLLNADGHLLEDTYKGIISAQQQQQQQHTQQQQQQQHTQQQQQYQNQQQYQLMLMLSKAQLPHVPTQPLNRPLTRVPLRIPVQPVWRQNVVPTPTSSAVDYYHYPTTTPSNTYQSTQQPLRTTYNYYTPTDGYYNGTTSSRTQQTRPYYPETSDTYSRPTGGNTGAGFQQAHAPPTQPYSSTVTSINQQSYSATNSNTNQPPYIATGGSSSQQPYGTPTSNIGQPPYSASGNGASQTPFGATTNNINQPPYSTIVTNSSQQPYGAPPAGVNSQSYSTTPSVNQHTYSVVNSSLSQQPYPTSNANMGQQHYGSSSAGINQSSYNAANTNGNTRPYRRPAGPMPEDPSTAMESYQSHRN